MISNKNRSSSREAIEPSNNVGGTVANSADQLHAWRLILVIGTLYLGAFLYGLDANIIGTAIPSISTDLHSLPDVAWYGAAYLLTVTAFQPFFGNLYKLFNAKMVYLVSLFIFEGSTALPSSHTLGRVHLGSHADTKITQLGPSSVPSPRFLVFSFSGVLCSVSGPRDYFKERSPSLGPLFP